jgi:hypothetical protein
VSNGEFEWNILTGAAPPSGPDPGAALPASESMTVLASLEDVRQAVDRVAGSAQRLMSLYTPDLEPQLYEQTPFLDIMKRFVLARSFAKVRVILADPHRMIRDNNRFLAMARRLTSYIDIRIAPGEARKPFASYLIADDRALVYRTNSESFDGVADFNNPPVARLHLNHFDEIWHSVAPEFNLRAVSR